MCVCVPKCLLQCVLQCVLQVCCICTPSGPLVREGERGFIEKKMTKKGAVALIGVCCSVSCRSDACVRLLGLSRKRGREGSKRER